MKAWTRCVTKMGCSALISGCLGGQTGEVGSDGLGGAGGQAQCPAEAEVPLNVKERYEGTYETAYSSSDEEFTCLPVAGRLSLDVRFNESAGELELKPCGAAWYPVTVQLHAQDESLNQTLSGYLSEEGRLELDEVEPYSASVELDEQQRTLSFRWFEQHLASVADCCEHESERQEHPLAVVEEAGVLALEASSEHLGVAQLHLAFSIATQDLSTCLETGTVFNTAVDVTVFDEDKQVLAELPGTAYTYDGKVLKVSTKTVRVDAFRAPELSPESQEQVFGLYFEAKIPLDEPGSMTLSLNLDVAFDDTNREILFSGESKP